MALINCVMVPIDSAVQTEFAKTGAYFAVNLAMDIVFFIDILVVFNTVVLVDYEEIRDRKAIAV